MTERSSPVTAAYQDTDDAEVVKVLAAVRHCANSWDGSARLVGNVRARDISRACTAAIAALQPSSAERDGPCFYCGEMTSMFAGNPGRWPLIFCQPDGTGKVKYHHTSCVVNRLRGVAQQVPVQTETAAINERLTNIYTWLREPDWIETASLEWLMEWMNRRPIAELAMVTMLMPTSTSVPSTAASIPTQ